MGVLARLQGIDMKTIGLLSLTRGRLLSKSGGECIR